MKLAGMDKKAAAYVDKPRKNRQRLKYRYRLQVRGIICGFLKSQLHRQYNDGSAEYGASADRQSNQTDRMKLRPQ